MVLNNLFWQRYILINYQACLDSAFGMSIFKIHLICARAHLVDVHLECTCLKLKKKKKSFCKIEET